MSLSGRPHNYRIPLHGILLSPWFPELIDLKMKKIFLYLFDSIVYTKLKGWQISIEFASRFLLNLSSLDHTSVQNRQPRVFRQVAFLHDYFIHLEPLNLDQASRFIELDLRSQGVQMVTMRFDQLNRLSTYWQRQYRHPVLKGLIRDVPYTF
jgi:hypothetical protein